MARSLRLVPARRSSAGLAPVRARRAVAGLAAFTLGACAADDATRSAGGGAPGVDTAHGSDDSARDSASDRARDSGDAEAPLPYPTRDPYHIKGIQPDFWPDYEEIAGNQAGGVAMNLVWASWEPTVAPPPCADGAEEYDGRCFSVDASTDAAIRAWSARGLVVTAVVYGVPAWARVANEGCSPVAPGFDIFCAPDDPADYGRFAGMLARRYDGRRGNGRIADFVIHNEVNANAWFDVGCGEGVACDSDTWVRTYAENYNAAYDAVRGEQPHAKVLVSFEHHFGATFDAPAATSPILSVETFLTALAPQLGDRAWQVAYHPYPPDLFAPTFGTGDWPRVTYGNLGILLQWLRARFPDDPHAWTVQLTESGINGAPPSSSEAAQASAVCDTLYNVLGTPGIESYIYHRMKDHPDEGGLQLGLAASDGTRKPAWSVWALANRFDLSPPQLACGFENLPYTRLGRYHDGAGNHWVTTRRPPDGYAEESLTGWGLARDEEPGSTLLYECAVGDDHAFVSTDVGCEGQTAMGPLGWIWDAPFDGGVALYRCRVGAGASHFVTTDAGCEGQNVEALLGYARASAAR